MGKKIVSNSLESEVVPLGVITNQFVQKKLGPNFIFWILILLGFVLLFLFDTYLNKGRSDFSKNLNLNLSRNIDVAFFLALLFALFLLFVYGAIKLALKSNESKDSRKQDIGALFDVFVSQFITIGSLTIVSVLAANLVLFVEKTTDSKDQIIQVVYQHEHLSMLGKAIALWLIAFAIYFVCIRFGFIKQAIHSTQGVNSQNAKAN